MAQACLQLGGVELGEAAARRRGSAAEPLLDIPRQGGELAARVTELTAAADQRCGLEDAHLHTRIGWLGLQGGRTVPCGKHAEERQTMLCAGWAACIGTWLGPEPAG